MQAQTLTTQSLIEEIEARLKLGSQGQRAHVLRKVTELFLDRSDSIVEEQVAFFGEVFEHLIREIESQSLITLSKQLAPVANAPSNIIRLLSRHDDIEVSGPVLEKSERLTDDELVDISKTKSQAHLNAIAGRQNLSPAVTDVLVRRGEADVANKVAANPGAAFSGIGFTGLVLRAQRDGNLATTLARRPELTPELLKMLVSRAEETVRQRLLEQADPTIREEIEKVVPVVAEKVERVAAARLANSGRHSAKTLMKRDLGEIRSQIADFAAVGRSQEMIDAFASLAELPVEIVKRLFWRHEADAILILCKASGLGWPTVKAVLAARANMVPGTAPESPELFDQYFKLSPDSAQRVLRFMKARLNVSEKEIKELIDRGYGQRTKSAAAK